MVVVAMIAILSGFALMNMDFDNRPKKFAEQAFKIAALMQLASDEAIYLQKELGLRFSPEGYSFYQLTRVKKTKAKKSDSTNPSSEKDKALNKPHWVVSTDKRLRQRPLMADTEILLEISGVDVVVEEPTEDDVTSFKVKPQILILSNGELVPDYHITLVDADSGDRFSIASGVRKNIIVERIQ